MITRRSVLLGLGVSSLSNGESTQGRRPYNSALLGVLWRPTSKDVFLDAEVRRGITSAAPDWQITVGLTVGFSRPALPRP
jgi:hypothetical protein